MTTALKPSHFTSTVTDTQTSGLDFLRVVQKSAAKHSNNSDYKPATSDTKPPSLNDYKSIDNLANDQVRYVTQNDEKVLVDKQTTPELYKAVINAQKTLEGIAASKDDGYRRASDNEVWPSANGTTVGAVNERGPDLIRYHTDKEKVIVYREDNPELFNYLSQLRALVMDPDASRAVEKSQSEGFTLADRGVTPPDLMDYKHFTWEGEIGSNGVISYETADGKKVVVSGDLTPELYAVVKDAVTTRYVMNQQTSQGLLEAGPTLNIPEHEISKVGSPETLGNGLISFETRSGEKYIVSDKENKALYDQIVAKSESNRANDVSTIRNEHNLPPLSELDVLNMETDQLSDPNNKDSERLTVSEAATQNLIDEYKKAIEKGDLGKDSDEAKLILALEAKVALNNGRSITGYTEEKSLGGTWRESNSKQTQLTKEDMQDIIDGRSVDDLLSELFSKEKIAGDYQAKLDEALGKIGNKEDIANKLYTTLTGEDYVKYLKDLKEHGMENAGSTETANLLQSLTLIDPEKAKQAQQELMKNSMTADLNELVADPTKVSQSAKEQGMKDVLTLIKSVLKYDTFDIPRRAQETIEKFINEFLGDKQKLSSFTKVVEDLNTRIQAGDMPSEADIKKALQPVYTEFGNESAGRALNALNYLNNMGVLGSLGGTVGFVSGFYQLFGQNGKLADQPLERLAIAKDFISFLGASQHFIKFGSDIVSRLPGGSSAKGFPDLLGLSKTLPQIWGSNGTLNKEMSTSLPDSPKVPDRAPQLPDFDFNTFSDDWAQYTDDLFSREVPTTAPAGGGSPDIQQISENLGDTIDKQINDLPTTTGNPGAGNTEPKKPTPNVGHKIAGSVVRVLSGVGDTFGGVADIVLGAFTIKAGIQSGSDLQKAAGSLQIVGGVSSGVAGGIGLAGLFGSVGAASAFAGPLALLGVVLLGVGGIITYFVEHEKKQKATDAEGKWYHDLADAGLTQSDWGDKVEYARYSIYEYGGREAPDNESLFDYQSLEWEYFDRTPQDHGTSSNRLEDDLHRPKDGDTSLPIDQYGKAFYEEHKDHIETIRSNWDSWNGKDSIVSKKDLEKIANDGGNDQEKNAARFLLDNQGFFDFLDTLAKKDGTDTKISNGDLNEWVKLAGI
jgi:protein-tyrosine-phosphatase